VWVGTRVGGLHVECVERGKENGILFIVSLFCVYIQFEYICIHVIYRVNQAEYGMHIFVVAPQEYVNIDSTRRVGGRPDSTARRPRRKPHPCHK